MPMATRERQREYQRKWRADRRAAWLAGKSCVDCDATNNLEIDHIDPRQKVHHCVWSWSRARREAELAKCRVLCRPCHARRHRSDKTHNTVRLNEQSVREIRRISAAGRSLRHLASDYGVNHHTIWDVVHRHTWKDVA